MKVARGATNHRVRRFRNLKVGLRELEPFIRNGQHLQTGRPFRQLRGMLSREALANWLVCAVANFEHGSERMSFTSDPTGGDGIIHDSDTQTTWKTEHVMVRRPLPTEGRQNRKSVETQILEAVAKKQAKGGAAYASGKQLVVFLDSGGGEWYPNKVARSLRGPLLFDEVWVAGLHGPVVEHYVYGVTLLSLVVGNAPTWLVRIATDFSSWSVTRIQ
jgi:hypothetical protein